MLPLNSSAFSRNGVPQMALNRRSFCPPLRHRAILAHHLTVMAEVEGDIKARQRDAADDLVDMSEFRSSRFA